MVLCHKKNVLIIYIVSYFVGYIYAVVSLKDSEWGGDYLLACCIEGNQTLNISMIGDESNHFPIRSMVVKGKYLTYQNNAGKKDVCVYRDYKLGACVYHFTKLIIGTNLQV